LEVFMSGFRSSHLLLWAVLGLFLAQGCDSGSGDDPSDAEVTNLDQVDTVDLTDPCQDVVCAPADSCHEAGVCDAATGECVYVPVTDGTACGDGDKCNGDETCQAGLCAGGAPLTCDGANPCVTGACEPDTGCVYTENPGGVCAENASCQGAPGAVQCACDTGYAGDPSACADVDECTDGSAACDENATCTNSEGSYSCACDPGYEGDGLSCGDVDECAAGAADCDVNATCENTDGGFTCTCDEGYAGDGATCSDIDECETGAAGCDANAVCLNTDGSFTCTCGAGYAGDGIACGDIDECDTGIAGCDTNALCENTDGGYTCTCDVGFAGDGANCSDIDECDAGIAGCDENAACTNLTGSFSCVCLEGYAGDGASCTDIDECDAGTAGCDENAACTNLPGSFSCACTDGYAGDGTSCVLLDACTVGNGGCQQQCQGTGPGLPAICSCLPGFVLAGDEAGCEPLNDLRLFNVGLEQFLTLDRSSGAPFELTFAGGGEEVVLDQTADGPDTFTITIFSVPGICAGGGTSFLCPDAYRLCAGGDVPGMVTLLANGAEGTPAVFDGPECTWIVEDTGDGQVRLKNLWLQQTADGVDYLDCQGSDPCVFTSDGETAGNTLFLLDVDECAAGTAGCDANASCVNTAGDFTCVCDEGFEGDGVTCVQSDLCLVDNGGCAQRCLDTVDSQAVCGCYPGFDLAGDAVSCEPWEELRVYNTGLGEALGLNLADPRPEWRLVWEGGGWPVQMAPVDGTTDTFTFTIADGGDAYRLCAQQSGGFRWVTRMATAQGGTPSDWNAPTCAWMVEDAGDDQFRLKSLWLQGSYDYVDYLNCWETYDCVFTYSEELAGNTLFQADFDECAAGTAGCDANATCTNSLGGFDCVCNQGFAGDGTTCVQTDACVTDNGGCAQLCTNDSGVAVCGCFSGFTLGADGAACVAESQQRLYNVGLGAFLDVDPTSSTPAWRLEFSSTGREVHVEPSSVGPDAFTFTLEDGSTSYRLCANQDGGFRHYAAVKTGAVPPADWNSPSCTWLVEEADAGQVRLKNLWLQQTYPYVEYLDCWQTYDCVFAYDDETPGSGTLFVIDVDECAAGTDGCDADAACTNTTDGYTCACNDGFSGDGFECAQVNACVTNNGGCAQTCGSTDQGVAICGCFPGFSLNADGESCDPWSEVRLYNLGLGMPLAVNTAMSSPEFEFLAVGTPLQMLPTDDAPNAFTFTAEVTPGTCADGSTSGACVDSYRLCAHQSSGFRWNTLVKNALVGTPAGWDGPACTWLVTDAGDGQLRLKNLWLQQTYPYVDYLNCWETYDCVFTYYDGTGGNTLFVIDSDECAEGTASCDDHAICTNTAGGYDCTCQAGFEGDGFTCVQTDACVIDNGGCGQQCTSVNQVAQCGCFPGFGLAADGVSCESAGPALLYNVDLGLYLDVAAYEEAPYSFEFRSTGASVYIEATDDGLDTFTFTVDYTPGTCADGSTSPECVDQYRLCAHEWGGFRWDAVYASDNTGTPPEWGEAACVWQVEDLGQDQIRLKNLWLQQAYPYVDYLNCWFYYDCVFTYDDETEGFTTFAVVVDECATGAHDCSDLRTCQPAQGGYVCGDCPAGYVESGLYECADINECVLETTGCDPHAACSNTIGGFTCSCVEGYSGDGFSCAPDNACDTNNGGCAQICIVDELGAQCGCLPGFDLDADGASCNSWGPVEVRNMGLGLLLDVFDPGTPYPYEFRFNDAGHALTMAPTGDGPDVFTFTVEILPGTCADGSTSNACTDAVRLCAAQDGGFRWETLLKNAQTGTPADWDSPSCKWIVEDLGGDQVRLKSLWLQQTYPYVDYLDCWLYYDCIFTYDDEVAGNTAFRIQVPTTDLCEGVTCEALDSCHGVGQCAPATGLCDDPPLEDGTPCEDGDPATVGDACASGVCLGGGDLDGDGVIDDLDLCLGDDASGDTDEDGYCDDSDDCPTVPDPGQADQDGDGIGDICDNCPATGSVSQADTDGDGVGDVCDPDFQIPGPPEPVSEMSWRPACGFVPKCPGSAGATAFNSYLFSCYSSEPDGGEACLGDRWWHHLHHRIYPGMVGTQSPSTTEGILDELEKPENNEVGGACTNDAQCGAGSTCPDGFCITDAVRSYIDRLSASSDFLSCTGDDSYESSWPAARVVNLDTGTCGWSTLGQKTVFGYHIENTMSEPMTIWVGKGGNDPDKYWWTLNPGEHINFNAFDGAKVFATTAEAYHACSPEFISKTVYSQNTAPFSHEQVSAVPLVRYTVAPAYGGGSLTIYRDRTIKLDIHLFEYPNYFGVGLTGKGTNGSKKVTFYRYWQLQCF
jgi:hypothetical protein